MDALIPRRARPAVVVLLTVLVGPTDAAAQAVTGTLLGNVTRSGGAADARRDRHHHRDEHEHQPQRGDQRSRLLHVPELEGRHLPGRGGAGRLQEGRARGHHRAGQHDDPRRPADGGRHPRRIDHRRRREPDPADRPHRHRAHHRIEDGERHAAHLQPELPEHPDHGAGHHAAAPRALGVLQLAGLARRGGQRPAAPWRTIR